MLPVGMKDEVIRLSSELLHPFDLHGPCEANPSGAIDIVLRHTDHAIFAHIGKCRRTHSRS